MDGGNVSLETTAGISDPDQHNTVLQTTPPRQLSSSFIAKQCDTPSTTEPVTPRSGLSSLASPTCNSSLLSAITAWKTPPTSPISPSDRKLQQKLEQAEIEIECHEQPEVDIKPLPLGVRLDSPADVAEVMRRGQREPFHPPCLQCALKALPCDIGFPYCARCARTGEGEMCLNQRPVWPGEVKQDDAGLCMLRFALVRFEENDETWALKKKLESELMEQMQLKLDKQNWILPDLFGKRGVWNVAEFNAWMNFNHTDRLRGKRILPYFWRKAEAQAKPHQIFS